MEIEEGNTAITTDNVEQNQEGQDGQEGTDMMTESSTTTSSSSSSSSASATTTTNIVQPNQTLYVHNLKEKTRIEELKRALYELFSAYGPIYEIVARRSLRMRGQAFIIFKELQSATNAMRELQGMEFLGKNLIIEYAKDKSDFVANLDGTLTQVKAAREERKKKEAKEKAERAELGIEDEEKQKAKKQQKMFQRLAKVTERNKSLFVSNVADDTNEEEISALFGGFEGFQRVRSVPNMPEIAFVDYNTEYQAEVALNALQGYKLGSGALAITYVKK
eukprot:TRINITY_DN3293_c0_g2_i3.p1 TRINITY_DN3293_c0_g2~~TRINITY_DN3293_c0_g2_i3.p1  ORF type:complete len:299 (+),score=121.25 TRINITY_DN3293_c0_g2_i3:67-897(+)